MKSQLMTWFTGVMEQEESPFRSPSPSLFFYIVRD